MVRHNFDPSRQLVWSRGLKPWIKMQLMYLILMDLFREGSWKKVSRRLSLNWVGNERFGDRIPIHTHRTHNRNRSLSFINSDQLVNVNKGSRQIKPVTLGKRLALMIGHRVNLVWLSTWFLVSQGESSLKRNRSGKSLLVTRGGSRKMESSFYLPLPFAIELELLRTRRIRLFNQNLALWCIENVDDTTWFLPSALNVNL